MSLPYVMMLTAELEELRERARELEASQANTSWDNLLAVAKQASEVAAATSDKLHELRMAVNEAAKDIPSGLELVKVPGVLLARAEAAERARDAYLENLTATQATCTKLRERCRVLEGTQEDAKRVLNSYEQSNRALLSSLEGCKERALSAESELHALEAAKG